MWVSKLYAVRNCSVILLCVSAYNHNYAEFIFRLLSDLTVHAIVVQRGTVSGQSYPTIGAAKGVPYKIIHRLVATQFS